MTTLIRRSLAMLLVLALLPWAAPVRSADKDPEKEKLIQELKEDKGEISTKLAEQMLSRMKRQYTAEDKIRQDRDRNTLLEDIKADPTFWATYAALMKKADQPGGGGLTEEERKHIASIQDGLNKDLGLTRPDGKTTATKNANIAALRIKVEGLKAKITDGDFLEARGGINKFYEDELEPRYKGKSTAKAEIPSLDGKNKRPLVKESEIIRGWEAGDKYIYRDGSYKVTHGDRELRVMLRSKSDDPEGLYGYIADVTADNNIRGQTFSLVPGTQEKMVLNGQPYVVKVVSKKIEDRWDTVVHVFAADGEGNPIGGKKVGQRKTDSSTETDYEGGNLEKETIRLGGVNGLAAKALTKAVEGHHSGNGTSEAYVANINGKKYYAMLQGGATAGLAFYPYEEANAAYEAIQNKREPRLVTARMATDIWNCTSGVAKAFSKDGSSAMDIGEKSYRYKFDAESQSWTLVSGKKEEEEKKAEKKESLAAGTPGEGNPPARGGAGSRGGSNSPNRFQGLMPAEKLNETLKTMGKDYRVFYDGHDFRVYAIATSELNGELSAEKLAERQLPTFGAKEPAVDVVGSALVISGSGRDLLFDITKPRTMKDTPMKKNESVPDPLLMSMVLREAGEKDPSMRILDLTLLRPGLMLLGFSGADVDTIVNRADVVIPKRKAQLDVIQAFKKDKGYEITVLALGSDKPEMIWPDASAAVKKETAGAVPTAEAGSAAPGSQGADAGGEGEGGNAYHLGSATLEGTSPGPWPMEDQIETIVNTKPVTLHKDPGFESKTNKYALYCNQKPCTSTARWYVRWRVFQTKGGVDYQKLKFPADVVDSGQNTPIVPIHPDMAIKPMILRDVKESNAVHIVPDRKHPGALEATMMASSEGSKHELFIAHVAFRGNEPKASDHEHAYLAKVPNR